MRPRNIAFRMCSFHFENKADDMAGVEKSIPQLIAALHERGARDEAIADAVERGEEPAISLDDFRSRLRRFGKGAD